MNLIWQVQWVPHYSTKVQRRLNSYCAQHRHHHHVLGPQWPRRGHSDPSARNHRCWWRMHRQRHWRGHFRVWGSLSQFDWDKESGLKRPTSRLRLTEAAASPTQSMGIGSWWLCLWFQVRCDWLLLLQAGIFHKRQAELRQGALPRGLPAVCERHVLGGRSVECRRNRSDSNWAQRSKRCRPVRRGSTEVSARGSAAEDASPDSSGAECSCSSRADRWWCCSAVFVLTLSVMGRAGSRSRSEGSWARWRAAGLCQFWKETCTRLKISQKKAGRLYRTFAFLPFAPTRSQKVMSRSRLQVRIFSSRLVVFGSASPCIIC